MRILRANGMKVLDGEIMGVCMNDDNEAVVTLITERYTTYQMVLNGLDIESLKLLLNGVVTDGLL